MYYKLETIQRFLDTRESFYKKTPLEVSNMLKSLPENLALKVIYTEIADVLVNTKNKEKMIAIASVSSEYGLMIPQDPQVVRDNVNKYLESDQNDIERSMDLLLKSSYLEDGEVQSIDVNNEEYEFLKQDFIEREKYELIGKLILT